MTSEAEAAGEAARLNAALDRAVTAGRYSTFLRAAGQDPDLARRLYVWDRDLATAVMADIAIVEVGLRNAMHRALSSTYTARWYQTLDLDTRCERQITTAWASAKKSGDLHPGDAQAPDRLVAGCSFGLWVNLLDTGGTVGSEPRKRKIDYETMWRASVHTAFPGGRTEAAAAGKQFTRTWTHGVAKNVNVLRNRVAHHEPIHAGYPLPGQRDATTGRPRRITVADGLSHYLTLARMIDRDLADWINAHSTVQTLLQTRPR